MRPGMCEGRSHHTTDPQEQTKSDADILPDAATERKADATLAAIAALNGFQARKLDGGAWLISRWSVCKDLPDRAAAIEFLRRAGIAV